MSYQPTWKERMEDAKPYVGPIVAGLVAVALLGWLAWYVTTGQSAKTVVYAAPKDAAVRMSALRQVSADLEALEKTYQTAVAQRGSEETVVSLLNRLVEKQRDLMRLEPVPTAEQADRLAKLEAERDLKRSQMSLARSRVLEKEAEAARAAGRNAEAVEKLREAQRLQYEANQNAPTLERKDTPRETLLGITADLTEAGPLALEVTTALTLARSAIVQERWDDALKAFTAAKKSQSDLNQRFPTTRFADLQAITRIDGEIESLRAAGLAERGRVQEHAGDVAAKAGKPADAATAYAAAGAVQREVNEKFPLSRFASVSRIEELEVRRQTVLSIELIEQAAALDREIVTLLRRKETSVAAEKITLAAKLTEQAATDYPRSKALDVPLQRKLAYLALRTGELSALQEQIYTRLAPLPGTGNIQLFKTEVPQELYQRVMNANPSRNAGRGLPVDSVSWLEAREFCERASWILGQRVRLPTEAEFRQVWIAMAGAWSAENSEGHSREAGKSPASPAGFFDLAGNLAEWLQPDTDVSETAPVAGGSYLDSADSLKTLRIVPEVKRERARHIGFRVIVERVVE